MAKNQVLTFGDFSIEIGTASTERRRDIQTGYVNEAGEQVTMGGAPRASAGGPGSRRVAPGVVKAAYVAEQWVKLPEGALEEIVERSKAAHETMQVLGTVALSQVPIERVLGTKWVTAKHGSGHALAIVAKALKQAQRVAVVKWLDTSREKLGVLRAVDGGHSILLIEIAFANDFAPAPEEARLHDVETHAAEIAAAVELLRAFAGRSADILDTESDTAVDARVALVESLVPSFEDALTAAVEQARGDEQAAARLAQRHEDEAALYDALR